MNIANHNKNEDKFQDLFNFATESLFLIDPINNDILSVNNAACITYGFSSEEFLKMKILDLTIEQLQTKEAFKNIQEERLFLPIHYHKKKDGTIFPVEIQSSFLTLKNQKVLVYIVKRVSEIKLDEILKQQMKDLLETQRIAHIGTWRLNVSTNEVVWSKELFKMYGFDSTLPVPPYTEHMKLFTPESWDNLSNSLELTRTLGIAYELELKTVTIDGSNGWMWVRGEAEKDENGNIVGIWGAAQDISERKRAEERVKLSENRFKKVVQNLNAGVVIHAPDSSVIECNDRASKLLGLSVEQIIGKVAIDLAWTFVDEEEKPLPLKEYPISLILNTKKPLENYLAGVFHPKNRSITWVIVNGTPILNDAGDILEVIISFIDFTEVKNSKDQIQASEEQYRLLTTEMQLGQALHEIVCDESGNPVDYKFISVNDAFEQLVALKETI